MHRPLKRSRSKFLNFPSNPNGFNLGMEICSTRKRSNRSNFLGSLRSTNSLLEGVKREKSRLRRNGTTAIQRDITTAHHSRSPVQGNVFLMDTRVQPLAKFFSAFLLLF